ncbi:G protein pathway suppressor 2-like [Patiria miniata]|uniref:G protein pathway suppressor 2 n=1 Tax=Patiria miniata TaxID=46514 RepID=A0A914ABQ4_PATMI|nr:G protein pathway suppressor 2-like [Patiria miniata]XP_038061283.1 G protein pathway suppressor 2-like [Patiria miniata]
MPGLLDRPKLTQAMAAALRHHILKERERKRQEEEEADKAIERKREEAERLRKKAEAESLSLEETKDQIKSMEEKLKSLQTDKHELFLQLKKVLNEGDNRRRQQMKEKSDLMVAMGHHQYHPAMHMPGPHMIVQGAHMQGRPAMLDKGHVYRTAAQQPTQGVHGVKRNRSPSPPVVELYPQHPVQQGPYAQGPYGQSQASHGSYRQGHQPYSTSQANSSYVNQSATGYPPGQQAVHAGYGAGSQSSASKYRGESAFSSYPNHFVPQQTPQAYQAQPHRYIHGGQSASAASIAVHQQQTVDQSVKQGPYADEQGHYQHKLQGQHVRQIAGAHPQALHAQQALLQPQVQSQVHLQQQQGKPSMPSSYTPRRKPESPIYQHKKPNQQHQQTQPQPHGTSYQSPQQAQRHGSYPTSQSQHQQGSNRFY